MMALPRGSLPDRWRDLDKRTIEMIARFNEVERVKLLRVLNMPDEEWKRLEEFFSLTDEEFETGIQVFQTVTKLKWVGFKGFWLMSGVAAFFLIYNQIADFVVKNIVGVPK